MSFRIHFLVPDPKGPIVSGPGGNPLKIGKHGRFVAACNREIQLSEFNRATGEPYAVVCSDCQKTEAFKKAYRPKPGTVVELDEADPDADVV